MPQVRRNLGLPSGHKIFHFPFYYRCNRWRWSFPMIATLLAISIVLLVVIVFAYFRWPQHVAVLLIGLNRKLSRLSLAQVAVGPHTVHYLQGGTGPSVVLLHGIFAEKDHWVDFARPLTGSYQVFAPDLPGFGESGRFADQEYHYEAQVERLRQWMDALGLTQVHLGGSSMGGTLSALFAVRYPQRVLSVAFIGAPHGLKTPRASTMDRQIEEGLCPLIVRSPAEFQQMFDFLFARRPFLPAPIVKVAMADAIANADSNVRLWQAQLQDRFLLDATLSQVTAPSLALWGAQDKLFDASGVEVIRTLQPMAQVEVLEGVGHLPMMEAPARTARRYRDFLG